jgi:hypothetical protein
MQRTDTPQSCMSNETRIALELSAMLPNDKDEAFKIIAIMKDIIEQYFEEGEGEEQAAQAIGMKSRSPASAGLFLYRGATTLADH